MALHLHRAERTDLLADGLGALLSDPLPDPFTEEVVIVPAKGVERWLSQRLSHVLGRGAGEDGVCAGISFRSPRSLIADGLDIETLAGSPPLWTEARRRVAELSPRQREVLWLVAAGLSSKEAAIELGCSPRTLSRPTAAPSSRSSAPLPSAPDRVLRQAQDERALQARRVPR